MNKDKWKKTIEKACQDAGTYQPYFDSVIDTLSLILETRDNVHQQFLDNGAEPTIVKYTDRSNKPNINKNPMLTVETELHSQALAYWNALGLTPLGLKKLKADVVNNDENSIEDLLEAIKNG